MTISIDAIDLTEPIRLALAPLPAGGSAWIPDERTLLICDQLSPVQIGVALADMLQATMSVIS